MKQQKQKAVKQVTVTLYDYIQSELIKKGLNEFVDHNGNLIFFNDESQFMTKIFSYDEDISTIVDKLFTGVSLTQYEHDMHFKKAFLYKFINRRINRQTIEAFRIQLLSTFLVNKDYINRIYADLELFLAQNKTGVQNNSQSNSETNSQTNAQNNRQTNNQTNNQTATKNDLQTSEQKNNQRNNQTNSQTNSDTVNGNSTTDNREADATLPQNNVHLDVNSTVMTTADTNRISRNKQANNQTTTGKTDGETIGTTIGDTVGTNVGESTDLVNGETAGETAGNSDSLTTGESAGETSGTSDSLSKDYRLDELFKTRGLQEQIYIIFDKKCFMQTW